MTPTSATISSPQRILPIIPGPEHEPTQAERADRIIRIAKPLFLCIGEEIDTRERIVHEEDTAFFHYVQDYANKTWPLLPVRFVDCIHLIPQTPEQAAARIKWLENFLSNQSLRAVKDYLI